MKPSETHDVLTLTLTNHGPEPVVVSGITFMEDSTAVKGDFEKASLYLDESLTAEGTFDGDRLTFAELDLMVKSEIDLNLHITVSDEAVKGHALSLQLSEVASSAGITYDPETVAAYIGGNSGFPVIDGLFGEWTDPLNDEVGDVDNPNVDISAYDARNHNEETYFYLNVEGNILQGNVVPATRAMNIPSDKDRQDVSDQSDEPSTSISTQEENPLPVETGEDAIYIFMDTNGEVQYGYKVKEGFYANEMIEIIGQSGSIHSSNRMLYVGSDVDSWSWEKFTNIEAESDSDEIEVSGGSFYENIRILFHLVSWNEEEDFSHSFNDISVSLIDDSQFQRGDDSIISYVEDELIIGYSDNVGLAQLTNTIEKNGGLIKKHSPLRKSILVIIEDEEQEKFFDEIIQMDGIQYIESNHYLTTAMIPNDSLYATYQWGVDNIDCPTAWDTTVGNDNVIIAILDTGVDYNHEDLTNNMWESSNGSHGWDCVNGDQYPMDDNMYGYDSLGNWIVTNNYHGTHCAGIASAEINNNKGIAGVAQAQIMAVKVLNESGVGTTFDVADGIEFATDQGAHIISMSLSASVPISTVETVCTYAWNKGVLIVGASGNSNSNVGYPAAYSTVIAVGATDQTNDRVYFSNYGPELELCAPGVSIASCRRNDTYVNKSGTSMATPFIAGVAGLVLSMNPSFSNALVRSILQKTADDLGSTGWDEYYGYGKVNASQAIEQGFQLSFDSGTDIGDADGTIWSVTLGDLDNDGYLDIIDGDNANDVRIYQNKGDGSFYGGTTIGDVGNAVFDVAVADLNNDGYLDIVSGDSGGNVYVWKNDGTPWGSWGTKIDIGDAGGGVYSVALADFDNDGDIDIVSGDDDGSPGSRVYAWENPLGTSDPFTVTWDKTGLGDAGGDVYSVAVGDLDNDGYADIISGDDHGVVGTGNVYVFENTGSFSFNPGVDIGDAGGDIWGVAIADIDNDGALDIVSGDANSDVYVWKNSGSPWSSWSTYNDIGNANGIVYSISVGDFDNDGDIDIVSGDIRDNVTVWENDGTPFSGVTLYSNIGRADGNVYGIAVGDIDNDGDTDIISGDSSVNIFFWKNTQLHRNAVFDSANYETTIDGDFDGAKSVFAADIDGDGDMDVLGAAYYPDDILWWENTAGDGSAWTETTIDGDFDEPMSVHAADMDGDGDMDVLGAAYYADDIAWWENTAGDGSVWTETTIDGDFDYAVSVFAADLDGDGDMDVLGAAGYDDDITWWENIGGQVGYKVTDTAPSTLGNSQKDDILKIKVEHNGISTDNDIEINRWNLLFEETTSDQLTSSEVNVIIDILYVYLDDGDGAWEGGEDTLVTTISTLSLTDGVQKIIFTDGDPNCQVSASTSEETYFIVVQLTFNAALQTPKTFQITFDADDDSLNEDRTEDTSITVADSLPTTSGNVEAILEFSTIFLPIAAITSLLILFRKKRVQKTFHSKGGGF